MADKPVVFLSHITEEAELAALIKAHIQEAFLGMIDVFVSSDGASIPLGRRWLGEVSDNLARAKLMIVLCSQASVKRPWINFESGAGWVRGIDIVPICHTNLRLGGLPIPLSLLQGMEAGNEGRWRDMYRELAGKLGSREPMADFARLVVEVQAFEAGYRARLHAAADGQSVIDEPPRESPAVEARSGVRDESRDRVQRIRRYMGWLVDQLDGLNPDFASGERAQDLFLASCERAIPLVSEFAQLAQLVAQFGDEQAAEAIYAGFQSLLDRYEGRGEKPFPTHHINGHYIDYDFYRFMGYELLVTFISFLVEERRWVLLDQVLARGLYVTNRPNVGGRVEQFEYANQEIVLLSPGAKPFAQNYISPYASFLYLRHAEGDLKQIVPHQQFMDADLLLYMRSYDTSGGGSRWTPWSTLYLKKLPRYLLEAVTKRGAEELLKPMNLATVAELRGMLNRRKEDHPGLFNGGDTRTALVELDPMKFGWK